jgi:hypothetical protein
MIPPITTSPNFHIGSRSSPRYRELLAHLADLTQEACFVAGQARAGKRELHLPADRASLASDFQNKVTNVLHNAIDCARIGWTYNVLCQKKDYLNPQDGPVSILPGRGQRVRRYCA